MKSRGISNFYLAVSALLIMSIAACGNSTAKNGTTSAVPLAETPAAVVAAAVEPAIDPIYRSILVTFLTGRVVAINQKQERELDIGDELSIDDEVQSGEDSSCDIQFGSLATVRVKQNTRIAIRNAVLGTAGAKVDVGLTSGTILCKVQKLSGNERFEIRTTSAVCGVRGTEFVISSDKNESTRVAVNKGKVAIIPASLDPATVAEKTLFEAIPASVQVNEKRLSTILDDYFTTEAPLVGENGEFTVTAETSDEAAKVVTIIALEVASQTENTLAAAAGTAAAVVPNTPASAPAAEKALVGEMPAVTADSEAVAARFKAALKSEVETVMEIPAVSPATTTGTKLKSEFAEFATVRLLTPAAPPVSTPITTGDNSASTSGAEAAASNSSAAVAVQPVAVPVAAPLAIKMALLQVEASPATAEIVIDDISAGRGSASGLYALGTKLKLEIRAPGYETKATEIGLDSEAGTTLPITLKRAVKSYDFRATPRAASIILDGKKLGSGSASAKLEIGSKHEVLFQSAGYEDEIVTFTTQLTGSAKIEASLSRTIGSITLQAEPLDATISLNGKEVGRGSYTLEAPVGDNASFIVQAPGWTAKTVTLTIDARTNQAVVVALDRQKLTHVFRVQPASAQILLDDSIIGTGHADAVLEAGSIHEALFRASGYEDKRVMVTVGDPSRTEITAELDKIIGSIGLRAVPADAAIFINGEVVGTGACIVKAPLGEVINATFRAAGWDAQTVTLTIADRVNPETLVNLVRSRRVVEFAVQPGIASIILDEVPLGTEKAQAEFDVGSVHEAVFTAPGYVDKRTSFTVAASGSSKIEAVLERTVRSVAVKATPIDAAIVIADKVVGNGSCSLSGFVGDTLSVTVQALGWDAKTVPVYIADETGREVQIALVRSKRVFEFAVEPKSASIDLDGTKLNGAKAQAELEVGSVHEALFKAPGYVDKRTSFTVAASGSAKIEAVLERAVGAVAVKTLPADAAIVVADKVVGNGSCKLSGFIGDTLSVTVQAIGWETRTVPVNITDDVKAEIQVSLVRAKRVMEFAVEPKSAAIILDGVALGAEKDKVQLEVGSTHDTVFKAPGYVDKQVSFIVAAAGSAKIEAILERAVGGVAVTTLPADAAIVVADKVVGNGSCRLSGFIGDTVLVTVQALGWETRTVPVSITDDAKAETQVALVRAKRIFDFVVEPKTASIILDGVALGMGKPQAQFEVGSNHEAVFKAPGYVDKAISFTVAAIGSAKIEAVLERAVGSIAIKTAPDDAVIAVADKVVGTSSCTLKGFIGDTIEVTVWAPGWETKTVPVMIADDAKTEIHVSLIRVKRLYEFAVEPKSASIILDGSLLGTQSAKALLEVGSTHEAVFTAPGYDDKQASFTVSATDAPKLAVMLDQTIRTIIIKATPSEAAIIVDGKNIGYGTVSLSGPVNSAIGVNVEALGWETSVVDLAFTNEIDREVTVSLARSRRILEFQVQPGTASIILDGVVLGTAQIKAELEVGSAHEIVYRAPGYVEMSQSVAVGINSPSLSSVSLERATRPIVVSVKPDEAAISYDGKIVGYGSCTLTLPVGDTLRVTASSRGHNTQEASLAVSEGGEANIDINLVPSLIYDQLDNVSSPVVGIRTDAIGRLLVSDASGAVSVFGKDGQLLWTRPTANVANESSVPVSAGDKVYFSGAKEFVILSGLDGSVIKSVELSKDNSHLFGNRAAVFGDRLLIPTSLSLQVTDLDGTILREIPLADGTLSTPAIWKETAIVLTQAGGVAIIDPLAGVIRRTIATKAVQPVGAAPAVVGDMAYFSDRKGLVTAVDLAKGAVVWTRQATSEGVGAFSDLQIRGANLYGLFNQTVVALALADGQPAFSPITGALTAPALTDDYLAVGAEGGVLRLYDRNNGVLVGSVAIGGQASGLPTVAASSVGDLIIIGTQDGKAVLINPKGR